jgi:signal transduction histidine kinase
MRQRENSGPRPPADRMGDRLRPADEETTAPAADGRPGESTTGGDDADVRRLRNRVRELQRRNERLESFVGALDHDVRGPLVVAGNHLEFAREEPEPTHFDAIERAHDRLSALVEELRATAEGTGTDGERRPVSVSAVAEECWAAVDAPDAELVVDTDATVPADRRRLLRLFENLFRNSVEHGSTDPPSQAREDTGSEDASEPSVADAPDDSGERRGGAGVDVTVTVGALDGGFYVADDGAGIPGPERELVFEEGYTTDENGTGLGLAIVRDVVREHGWTIHLTRAENGGARFEITGVGTRPEP